MRKLDRHPSALAPRKGWLIWLIPGLASLAIAGLYTLHPVSHAQHSKRRENPDAIPAFPPGTVTFSHGAAQIIYQKCTPCHRTGQSAPFDLMTYREIQKHAKQIAEVVRTGYMPPWLPESGYGDFQNERRLTGTEKTLILQWLQEGSPEGEPTEAPPQPQWPQGWSLGKPDLVLTMEEPYPLDAEGADVYRNFVIPVPGDHNRFVRAIEFVPGNARIVHHAFIKLDTVGASRKLDGKEGIPGFSGMTAPAETPDGQFLAWQPGKVAAPGPDGMPWLLPKGSDLVLQVHLNRTGKPELLQSSIGLYFTDRAPTNTCFKLALISLAVDLPAGAPATVLQDSFTLPVDVDVLAVLPHAHYLAREMKGYALLPDGSCQWLLLIRNWDFRWQGDYRYAQPVHLPQGSTLHLEYVYDNSTNNLRNPNHPPARVVYGPQSSDEMCELWFQILPLHSSSLPQLKTASQEHMHRVFVDAAQHRIAVNPKDAAAHNELGLLLWDEGKQQEGWQQLDCATNLKPDFADAHLNKGIFLRFSNRFPEAKRELETALRLNPENERTYGHLGFVQASMGHPKEAELFFKRALELDPDDSLIKDALIELHEWQQSH